MRPAISTVAGFPCQRGGRSQRHRRFRRARLDRTDRYSLPNWCGICSPVQAGRHKQPWRLGLNRESAIHRRCHPRRCAARSHRYLLCRPAARIPRARPVPRRSTSFCRGFARTYGTAASIPLRHNRQRRVAPRCHLCRPARLQQPDQRPRAMRAPIPIRARRHGWRGQGNRLEKRNRRPRVCPRASRERRSCQYADPEHRNCLGPSSTTTCRAICWESSSRHSAAYRSPPD